MAELRAVVEPPDMRTAPMAMDAEGKVRVICEACGSTNLSFDGADIDKCLDCGHWRYREADHA